FTSGSTGAPKGVTISHRAAMAYVRNCVQTFDLRAQDRVSSHAPLHFDLSILDVFASIAVGATIVPITGAARVFPTTLAELIDREAISVWYSVPFALVQLARHGGLERFGFAALRCVLFAGEPMPVAPLRELMDRWPAARFHNLYGPTETNVVTGHEVTRGDAEALAALPIGREWPDAEVRLVDGAGRPVAAGDAGELWVCSATTMTGYWGDATATDRAFATVRTPAQRQPQRFYRTGDRVRRDDAGTLWFLGRTDDMVKVRGHRVELGEVQAALAGHPALAEATVVALPAADVGVELVAVVTPADHAAPPTPADVRAHCASRLPTYMVPTRVEVHATLPRTSTGKLDRHAVVNALTTAATPGSGR
ncbi:MAG TPA: AMP-binding protein, partial [Euzebya sp.]|nr:AMP-binding protein [Euzebya sp.]